MDVHSYQFFGSTMKGNALVTDRSYPVAEVVTNLQGAGQTDVYTSAHASTIKSMMDRPVEIRDDQGKLTRTLQPYTKEAMDYWLSNSARTSGLALEKQTP